MGPQVPVGQYRLDMAVRGHNDARLAIECGGDRYYGNGVRERFLNLTGAGVGHCRSMPRQEPVQIAEPFTEFWAKGTGASENKNRSLPPFPNP